MLNRRNLRVKVMQALYAKEQTGYPSETHQKNLRTSVQKSYQLYLFLFYTINEICRYSLVDNEIKKAKHIKTSEDANPSERLINNPYIKGIQSDEAFNRICEKNHFDKFLPKDLIKRLYKKVVQMTDYELYVTKPVVKLSDHKTIIKMIFKKVLQKEEEFQSVLEDHFPNWMDEKKSIISGLVRKVDSYKKVERDFVATYSNSEVDWEDFANFCKKLFNKTEEKEEVFLELIKPQLRNWDITRVAAIDILLIKMALAELLYFPEIPVKVTLNEYIDISKRYSTPKSKDFVNGILDRLMKQLDSEQRLVKIGRGLKE